MFLHLRMTISLYKSSAYESGYNSFNCGIMIASYPKSYIHFYQVNIIKKLKDANSVQSFCNIYTAFI